MCKKSTNQSGQPPPLLQPKLEQIIHLSACSNSSQKSSKLVIPRFLSAAISRDLRRLRRTTRHNRSQVCSPSLEYQGLNTIHTTPRPHPLNQVAKPGGSPDIIDHWAAHPPHVPFLIYQGLKGQQSVDVTSNNRTFVKQYDRTFLSGQGNTL